MRDLSLSHCTAALYGEPWAIQPEKLAVLVQAMEARKAGQLPTADDLGRMHAEAAAARGRPANAQVREVAGMAVQFVGDVAILPLMGTVVQRPSIFTRYSGGVSAEQFANAHAELVADADVKGVVWDVDSPGGSVAGVPEAADRLFALRGKKKTVALSNTLMASAGYWLASAADEVVVAPSSLTGSIGVVSVHEDRSRANDRAGVSVTYIHAGKRKVEGNADSPLSAAALAGMQQIVDDYYGSFVRAVARQRKTSEAAVRSGYGEGAVLTSRRAVAAGLADRVGTLADVVRGLRADAGRATTRAAAVSTSPVVAAAPTLTVDEARRRLRAAIGG